MAKAKIIENKLITALGDNEYCIANAVPCGICKFRWYGLGRFGTGSFDSVESALRAAAKRLGFEITQQ